MRIGEAPAKSGFRQDIQALRGAAVSFVVLYHSGLNLAAAGYLGVDLFFVISGFLITGIITRQIAADRFSFIDFYGRRVRRLLPAAYVVLVATTLACGLLLTTTQYKQFLVNLAGSVFFSANFTLWAQTDYFAANSAYNPLLHMWSLAIEEQYYLLLPVALVALPPRFWLRGLVLVAGASLIGGLALATIKPSVAFFWLPPRAWELGLGSIAALVWQRPSWQRAAAILVVPALAAILLVPIWPLPGPKPGIGAILVCLGAAIVIVANDGGLARFAPTRALARVGDLSYSLYLVHWPLFALARVVRMSPELETSTSILLIMASFALATLLYRFIEEPLRRMPVEGRKLFAIALATSCAVLFAGWALGQAKPRAAGREELEKPIRGLADVGCFDQEVTRFDGLCTQSAAPEVLLWGDSFSAHLVPALTSTTRHSLVQASKGHCSPFANYAAVAASNEHEWTLGCLAFNRSVIDYARVTPSLKVVVLSGQYFRSLATQSEYAIQMGADGRIGPAPLGLGATIAAQAETVRRLRALGLRVVVVTPPPPSEFDLGGCWERRAEGLLRSGPHRDCQFERVNRKRSLLQFEAMMHGFEAAADVPLLWVEAALCDARRCAIEDQGKPLFRDDGHFTPWGSMLVGRRLKLGQRAWDTAR